MSRSWLARWIVAGCLAGCGGTATTDPSSLDKSSGPGGPGMGGGSGGQGGTTVMPGTPTDPDDRVVVMTMDSFTVPAGGEVFKCQNFANPFGGGDAEVALYESHMTPGSHHMLLFFQDNAQNGSLETCSGVEFHQTAYATQTPNGSSGFPAGVAAIVPASSGFRFQSHYINTSRSPITAQVQVKMHLAKPGTVTSHAGVFFFSNELFLLQPNGQPTDVAENCKIPYNMNVIAASSHMHKHAVNFVATDGQQQLYTTTEWDEPQPVKFSPAMPLAKGSTVNFRCTFVNNTDSVITFGESADTNEMCIFTGTFYPVPPGSKSTVSCFF
jgi:hypothetical protein